MYRGRMYRGRCYLIHVLRCIGVHRLIDVPRDVCWVTLIVLNICECVCGVVYMCVYVWAYFPPLKISCDMVGETSDSFGRGVKKNAKARFSQGNRHPSLEFYQIATEALNILLSNFIELKTNLTWPTLIKTKPNLTLPVLTLSDFA